MAFVDGFGEEKVFNLWDILFVCLCFLSSEKACKTPWGEREREKISAVSSKGREKSSKTDGSRWLLLLNDRHHHHHHLYDDDASTDAGTHPYIETVSKPNDKKNGFERIRSPRFARVESATRRARPRRRDFTRFFVLCAGNRPTTRACGVCVARAKKKRGKIDAFPRVEKPRKRNRATFERDWWRERESVAYLFRDVRTNK